MAVLCCAFARRMTRTRPGSKGPETYAIRLPSRQGPKVPLHVPAEWCRGQALFSADGPDTGDDVLTCVRSSSVFSVHFPRASRHLRRPPQDRDRHGEGRNGKGAARCSSCLERTALPQSRTCPCVIVGGDRPEVRAHGSCSWPQVVFCDALRERRAS